jgi:BolA protein
MSRSTDTAARIERILRERFHPLQLEVRDDSARHAGHAGAAAGGGHYQVRLVAEEFRGLTRLEQHRLVHAALADLIGGEIHALGLQTRSPDEGRG